jgi:hypothetical protein
MSVNGYGPATAALQPYGYTHSSTSADPYPLAGLTSAGGLTAAGQTPADHGIYEDHGQDVATDGTGIQRGNNLGEQGAPSVGGGNGVIDKDAKARLRKACDSCSVRKVKVSALQYHCDIVRWN